VARDQAVTANPSWIVVTLTTEFARVVEPPAAGVDGVRRLHLGVDRTIY
jgi:hypothetical protein